MSVDKLPVLAVFPGDCTGIGPEQTVKILSDDRMKGVARIVLIGDRRVLDLGMKQARVSFEIDVYDRPSNVDWSASPVAMVDLGNTDPTLFPVGEMSPDSGKVTGDSLAAIIEYAKTGEIDGLTFAPLNKQALFKGGWQFPDEHKMFAHLLEHNGLFT